MARRSPRSTDAFNGSGSGSVCGSDYTVGTLHNDEDPEDNLCGQNGQSTQDPRIFQENRLSHEAQVYGGGQSSQEHRWADMNHPPPSAPPSPRPLKRFLTELDLREEFRLSVQMDEEANRAYREDSITLSESRCGSSAEIGRSNTVKINNTGSAKHTDRGGKNEDESKRESKSGKRRKRAKDGTRKSKKEYDSEDY